MTQNSYGKKIALTTAIMAALLAGWGALRAEACAIPVFRYALERWDADLYELFLYHEDALPEELDEALESINKMPLNLWVRLVDIKQDELNGEAKEIWEAEKVKATPPWGVLRYPFQGRDKIENPTIWSGKLDVQTLRQIVDSPVRRTVAEHILKGVSAVWIFVDGDDPAVNKVKKNLMQETLNKAMTTTFLPMELIEMEAEMEAEWKDETGMAEEQPKGFVPLRVDFNIVRMRRDDPAERFYQKMLLHIENEHKKFEGLPLTFPIFGQGRALMALSGDDIKQDIVLDACYFILGSCSCTVKELNPGVDMLMLADWLGGVSNLLSVFSDVPPLTGMMLSAEPELEDEDVALEKTTSLAPLPIGRVVVTTLGILLIAIAVISMKLLKHPQK